MLKPTLAATFTGRDRNSHAVACHFTSTRRLALGLLMVMLCLMPLVDARADELTNDQKQQLNSALSHLRQAKSNYDLVAKSASTGKALAGSKLKLAMIRLDSSKTSLDKAGEILKALPADLANVKAAADAHAAIDRAVAKLKAQLANPDNGTPAPPTTPNPPTQPDTPIKPSPKPAPPLSPTVKKQLADVDLILRMADVTLDNLGPVVDQLVADAASPGSAIQNAGNRILQTNAKIQQAKAVLQKLPLDHPKVAAVVTAWQTEANRTQAMAKKLLPKWNAIQKVVDGDALANYAKDIEMLKGLEDVYRNHGLASQDPETLAQTLANDKAVVETLQRVSATYKPMIEQQTNEGNTMAAQLRRVIGKRQAFLAAAKEDHPNVISRIEKLLAEVASIRTEAVEKKKPLFLTDGIESAMSRAETWIAVLDAYAPKLAAPYNKQLAEERDAVVQARVALKETIIQANPLPSDQYAGADRQALIDLAMASWKKEQPNAPVLAVRIPAKAWNRVTRWEGKARDDFKIEGSKIKVKVDMTKYDNSKIQIQLIVADSNPDLAVIRPVNLWKNHTNGDQITAYNFRSIKDELQPHSYLLRKKVK